MSKVLLTFFEMNGKIFQRQLTLEVALPIMVKRFDWWLQVLLGSRNGAGTRIRTRDLLITNQLSVVLASPHTF